MALADERRAIADGMAASRQATASAGRAATGQAIASGRQATGGNERRATGQRIVADRRGASVVDDLNRLVTPQQQRRQLRTVDPVGGLPVTRGRGDYVPPAATGGGIASPFTEQTILVGGVPVADREYYAAGIPTSDGLLVLPATKKQTFLDANGAEVVFDFATPGALP